MGDTYSNKILIIRSGMSCSFDIKNHPKIMVLVISLLQEDQRTLWNCQLSWSGGPNYQGFCVTKYLPCCHNHDSMIMKWSPPYDHHHMMSVI